MTQQATITVKYVNPPKGKGPASVKDDKGVYWKFWTTGKNPIDLETFREDQAYTVGYKTEQYNGKDQYTITDVLPSGHAPSAPRPAAANGGKYAPTDDKTAERIYVCGGLNAAITAGKVDVFMPDDVVSATESLRSAYQATFGKA